MIVRSFNPEENKDNKPVYNYDWTIEHGEKYIQAFLKELQSRKL